MFCLMRKGLALPDRRGLEVISQEEAGQEKSSALRFRYYTSRIEGAFHAAEIDAIWVICDALKVQTARE